MITVKIDDKQVRRLIASLDKQAIRAAEQAIDKTADFIKLALIKEMRRVFDNPVPYTINSLKVTKTRNHNMRASVWFKEPDRMDDHYLVPQVEGTLRKTKGFERALYNTRFIPSDSLNLDRYGNIGRGLITQILSALGRAQLTPGYQANRTKKSAARNKKDRDFVFLTAGSRRGKLPPGIYRRVITTSVLTKQQSRFLNKDIKAGSRKAGTYQQGRGQGLVSRARGLQPVLIVGSRKPTQPLLKFYDIARKVYGREFLLLFNAKFSELTGAR